LSAPLLLLLLPLLPPAPAAPEASRSCVERPANVATPGERALRPASKFLLEAWAEGAAATQGSGAVAAAAVAASAAGDLAGQPLRKRPGGGRAAGRRAASIPRKPTSCCRPDGVEGL